MIDQRNFLIWSLNELKKANFDQTTMLMPLFIFLAPEVSRSRTLIRHFFDISVAKMKRLKCLRETMKDL
ncbi:hypothetical protein BC829DRAFT_261149 [Chytridium lagenaria]|nr:hypothetical protein BC829DRAFT_261149 [Chytridium lagenaria]